MYNFRTFSANGTVTTSISRHAALDGDDPVRASERAPSRIRSSAKIILVPRLWATFAMGWLLVLVITMGQLLHVPIERWRLAATLSDLTLLAFLYLWLTLRASVVVDGDGDASGQGSSVRLRVFLLIAMSLAVLPPIVLMPYAGMWWQVTYVVVGAGLALTPRIAAAVIAALLAFAIVCAWLVVGQFELRLFIELAIGGAAMAVRHLMVTVEQLRVARVELARRAVDEERLRIARDLHDLLGHNLSLVALKSELAGRLINANPAAAAREIQDIERAARHALRQVRRAVMGYRQPTLRGELAAAREILAASGMRVAISDRVGLLPPSADTLFAWTVREGVTNVIRHSRAHECTIRTAREIHRVLITITDDGCGSEAPPRDNGNGLAGLKERAGAFAGTLKASRIPAGGFQLTLEIPVERLALAEEP